MGTLFAIAAALSWGVADLLSRNLARDIGSYRSLFYSQIVGLFALALYVVVSGSAGSLGSGASSSVLMTLGCLSLLYVVGALTLTLALEKGVLAIVSPIMASYAAITALLSWASGEPISAAGGTGVAILIVGVVMASISRGHGNERPTEELRQPGRWNGVIYAVIASVTYGVMLFILGRSVTPVIGAMLPALAFRTASIILLGSLAKPFAQSLAWPPRRVWRLVVATGLLDAGAFICLAEGSRIGPLSVVGAISSMATAVTVFLAWKFLDERLSRLQWGGVGLALAGIVLVNV